MTNGSSIRDTFLLYRAYLSRLVSGIVPRGDIEDIVQETYVRICQYTLKHDVKEPKALMAKIARNLAIDHVKRAERRLGSPLDQVSELELAQDGRVIDPLRLAVSNEEFGRFCEAVRTLPQQCRHVFVLKKVYGYSQKEISGMLNISENTVEKHIANGMFHCIQHLKTQERLQEAFSEGKGIFSLGRRTDKNQRSKGQQ